MSLADSIHPERDTLLIEKDPPPDPMAGTGLSAPESVSARLRLDSHSGTVLKSGPESWVLPGQRVIFPARSDVVVGLAGERGSELALISTVDVLALHGHDEAAA